MCVTDRHDMTLAVKVALNPNTTNEIAVLRWTVAIILDLFTWSPDKVFLGHWLRKSVFGRALVRPSLVLMKYETWLINLVVTLIWLEDL